MIMKKYGMLMGLMIVSTIIFAQQKESKRAGEGKYGEKMKKELALTDDQFNSVRLINKEFTGKVSGIRRDSTLTKESKHEKLKSVKLEKDAALKKVMSEEQFTKLKEHQSAQGKRVKQRRRHVSGDHAIRMQKNLSLSDDQAAKVKAIDKEYASKFQNMKRDSTKSKDDSKKLAKQLRDEHRTKTKSVLTDEQLQKWEAQRKERKKHSK
jgi:hypothetical protein